MIAGSLLLILVAVALLGMGLARGSNMLLVASIAASLLAAIVLVIGARQVAPDRVEEADEFGDEPGLGRDDRDDDRERALVGSAVERPTEAPASDRADSVNPPPPAGATQPAPAEPALAHDIPAQAVGEAPDEAVEDADPPDEPPPQPVSAADAARVARLTVDVLVIDGRPRYHLAGCVHLLGRESEPLPVGEAVELGFTPCSLCEPDSALLAEGRQV